MLPDTFMAVLERAGIPSSEQPVFYHAPVGMRFAIDGNKEAYQQDFTPNPLYVSGGGYIIFGAEGTNSGIR